MATTVSGFEITGINGGTRVSKGARLVSVSLELKGTKEAKLTKFRGKKVADEARNSLKARRCRACDVKVTRPRGRRKVTATLSFKGRGKKAPTEAAVLNRIGGRGIVQNALLEAILRAHR
jgi:hypothetical protein